VEVKLIDKNKKVRKAEIIEVSKLDLKKLKNWKFNWFDLYNNKNSKIFQLKTEEIEGLIKIEFIEPDFFELKNIEVSPSNFGSRGRFMNVAQLLISYGCLLSFELNKGPYQGYLTFVSKGELIDYYIKEYGAELAFRERMFISPNEGIKLIKKHLKVEL